MAETRNRPARAGLLAVGLVLRFALLAVPLALLRSASRPRPRPLSDFSDRDLADIGLIRRDVEPPGARPGAAELDLRWLRDRRGRG